MAIGFRAGLFNIGGRGQFLIGAVGAMAVVTDRQGGSEPWITVPLALLRGRRRAGAFAGFIPGSLKAMSGAHEVVTTIMLNYIFLFVMSWSVMRTAARSRAPPADHGRRHHAQRRAADPVAPTA